MTVTTDKDPKPEPAAVEQKKKKKNKAGEARREKADAGQKKKNAEEEAMNNSLKDKHHHNRQLLARVKMMTIPVLNMGPVAEMVSVPILAPVSEGNNNAEAAIVPDTAVVTATLPVEEINKIDNTVPEANQFAVSMNIKEIAVVSEAKSIDDETSESGGNEIVKEEEQEELTEIVREEEQLNADATIHGSSTTTLTTGVPPQEADNINYVPETNQFADVMNIKEIAVVSEAESIDDETSEARGNEIVRDEELEVLNVDATIHGTSSVTASVPPLEVLNVEPEKEQDVKTKRAVEVGITTEEKTFTRRFDTESSWGKEQDIEAIGVKGDVAAKKREKKKRQKKNKAGKLNGKTKSEKLDGVFPSVGVLSLALVCLLIYNFL